MAKSLLLAWSTPTSEETLAEFTTWYDEVHIPQIKAVIPSITVVNRYLTTQLDPSAPAVAPRYLTIYEIDEADVSVAAKALGEANAAGRMTGTKFIDIGENAPTVEWYQHV
jgi:hypothetical protein